MKLLSVLLSVVLLSALLLTPAAAESTVNPYFEIPVGAEMTEYAFHDLDFGTGASFLRLKAKAETKYVIYVYADDLHAKPIGTVVFLPVTKEARCRVDLTGIHSLYFVTDGTGTIQAFQAFTSEADVEAAIRAERGTAYEDMIPFRYTKACPEGGTIEKFVYQAHDYGGDAEALYEKAAFVYLPYGYDPDETYDLLILCHGIGGSEYEWGMTGEDSRVKRVMDNLIAGGEIRPFIVVTPNGRAARVGDQASFYLFDRELRNDLLPALAETYAVDIGDRNRCAMAGLSMGGMQTINLGIGKCLDLFCAFGAFSAAPTSNPAAMTAATLNAHPELPVRIFYSVCGTEDSIALNSTKTAVDGLDRLTDALDEKNLQIQYLPGAHDFGIWYLGFYNFARLFAGE